MVQATSVCDFLEKIKILLNFLKEPVGLIPVDISEDQLFVSAKNLENLYPNLEILPVAADFTKPIPIQWPNSGECVTDVIRPTPWPLI